jgi:hypothetical protein
LVVITLSTGISQSFDPPGITAIPWKRIIGPRRWTGWVFMWRSVLYAPVIATIGRSSPLWSCQKFCHLSSGRGWANLAWLASWARRDQSDERYEAMHLVECLCEHSSPESHFWPRTPKLKLTYDRGEKIDLNL